jgi:hypothetical protein
VGFVTSGAWGSDLRGSLTELANLKCDQREKEIGFQ